MQARPERRRDQSAAPTALEVVVAGTRSAGGAQRRFDFFVREMDRKAGTEGGATDTRVNKGNEGKRGTHQQRQARLVRAFDVAIQRRGHGGEQRQGSVAR